MRGQLRIYTINDGQMEAWLDQFDILIPMFAKAGITVQGSWVEVEENNFGWIRTFDNDDIDASRKRFSELAEWKAVKDTATSYVANLVVKEIDYR